MKTTLTINGTPYDATARSAARFLGIDELTLALDNRPDSLSFTVDGCGPATPFPVGATVQMTTTNDDGTNPQIRFTGDLLRPRAVQGDRGQAIAYTASDLRARGDRVALVGPGGEPTAQFNLPPDNPLYQPATAGLTVGRIVGAILQGRDVAGQLAAAGIGRYIGRNLPSPTQADLAALTIVPKIPIRLTGDGLFAQLAEFVAQYHPKVILRVEPDGMIRFYDVTNLPRTFTINLPTDADPGDPVEGLDYDVDVSDSYGQYVVRGLDVGKFLGSLVDKTISPAWTTDDQKAWTIQDYLAPSDSADQGAATGVGSTSCTVQSDDPGVHWDAGYWQGVGGVIDLIDPVAGAAITVAEQRVITDCSALTPGGTATISWDASQPLNSSGYTRYRLTARNTPLAEVGRRHNIVEPKTGNTNLDTIVESSLYPTFPIPQWVGNNSNLTQTTSPVAVIQWSADGSGKPPFYEQTVGVQLDPLNGQILLVEPAAYLTTAMDNLERGYPTIEALGAPHDVLVYLPYVRGQLNAIAPPDGSMAGTASSKYGWRATKIDPVDSFIWTGDLAYWSTYAAENLAVMQDAAVEGAIRWLGLPDPGRFDPMRMGYNLRIAAAGEALEHLDGVPLPVRQVRVRWPAAGSNIWTVDFDFSNRRRRNVSANLGTHPAFGTGTFGLQDGGGFGGAFGAGAAMMPAGLGMGAVGMGPGAEIGAGATIGPAASLASPMALGPAATIGTTYGAPDGGLDADYSGFGARIGSGRRNADDRRPTDQKNRQARQALSDFSKEHGPIVAKADPGRDVASVAGDIAADARSKPYRDDDQQGG